MRKRLFLDLDGVLAGFEAKYLEVFGKNLVDGRVSDDELTHELIFRSLASDAAMAKHLGNHEAGRLALGLEP